MIPHRRLWAALVVLAMLSPLALYVEEATQAGAAWGEWGAEELAALVGYAPDGLRRLAAVWRAPLPDYAFPGAQPSRAGLGLAYAVSALVGMGACAGAVYLAGRWLLRSKP